jgi:UDP-N-acetylglucosamine 2-epimerase
MLKVMTIVGTRPELIKMSRVIAEFDHHTQHVLVHTGQNYDYELNQVFFDDLEIRIPDHFLGVVGENAAQTIARVIEKADEVLAAATRHRSPLVARTVLDYVAGRRFPLDLIWTHPDAIGSAVPGAGVS